MTESRFIEIKQAETKLKRTVAELDRLMELREEIWNQIDVLAQSIETQRIILAGLYADRSVPVPQAVRFTEISEAVS